MAVNLFSGVPSSNVRTLRRSNSTGGGLSAGQGCACGTLVTSCRLKLRRQREVEAARRAVLSGKFITTSTPSVRGVDAVDEEAAAAHADEALRREVAAHRWPA